MAVADTTAARLRELFDYQEQTGDFVRLIDVGARASHHKAGTVAGTAKRSGYVMIGVDGKLYYAHRLAWLYTTGEWPKHQIDHINCNKSDNRIANLREATKAQNMQNRKAARKDSTTGELGVMRRRQGGFTAAIVVGGKNHYLGFFSTAEEAHAAHVEAKRKLHPFSTL